MYFTDLDDLSSWQHASCKKSWVSHSLSQTLGKQVIKSQRLHRVKYSRHKISNLWWMEKWDVFLLDSSVFNSVSKIKIFHSFLKGASVKHRLGKQRHTMKCSNQSTSPSVNWSSAVADIQQTWIWRWDYWNLKQTSILWMETGFKYLKPQDWLI